MSKNMYIFFIPPIRQNRKYIYPFSSPPENVYKHIPRSPHQALFFISLKQPFKTDKRDMIHTVLNTLAEKMNEFLTSYYKRSESMVEVGAIEPPSDEEASDKIILSVINIERETAMGINTTYQKTSSTQLHQKSAPWFINIQIMVAAVFAPKRYEESLKVLSDCISFLQQESIIYLPEGQKITLEPVTLGIQELSNIWSILGGHYYPSVLCKARMLSFDGSEIKQIKPRITQPNIN